jgi:hypothetical protein
MVKEGFNAANEPMPTKNDARSGQVGAPNTGSGNAAGQVTRQGQRHPLPLSSMLFGFFFTLDIHLT